MSETQVAFVFVSLGVLAIFVLSLVYDCYWLGRDTKGLLQLANERAEATREISQALSRLELDHRALANTVRWIEGACMDQGIANAAERGRHGAIDFHKLAFAVGALMKRQGVEVLPVEDKWQMVATSSKDGAAS